MGESSQQPAINEVVHFLALNAPAAIESLKEEGPDYAAVLRPGVEGGVEAQESEAKRREGLIVRATVLVRGLGELIGTSDQNLARTLQLLRRIRIARFLATAISAVGASGLIGAIILNKRSLSVTLSILTLTSNFISIWVDNLVLGPGRQEKDLLAAMRTFSSGKTYAKLTVETLSEMLKGDFDLEEVTNILKEANNWFAQLTDAAAVIG